MRMTSLLACLLFVLLLCANAFGTEWRLGLCYSQGATATDKAYLNSISVLSSHVYKVADAVATTEVQRRQCTKEPEIDCYTEMGVTFCREEPLAHIIRSAMWLAAAKSEALSGTGSDKDKISAPTSLTWSDAYLLGEARNLENKEMLDKLSKTIIRKRQIGKDAFDKLQATFNSLNRIIVAGFPLSTEQMKNPTNQLLVGSLDYAFSFFIGHESYHLKN